MRTCVHMIVCFICRSYGVHEAKKRLEATCDENFCSCDCLIYFIKFEFMEI